MPIATWMPWNPVVIKKILPNVQSLKENRLQLYSKNWKYEKIIPSITVIINENKADLYLLLRIEWWDHVTVTPDLNRINVFKRGIWKGLNIIILVGGQVLPISTSGASLKWKNLQKNLKKNMTSLRINIIILYLKPFITLDVWYPRRVPSRIASRHHMNIEMIIMKKQIWVINTLNPLG